MTTQLWLTETTPAIRFRQRREPVHARLSAVSGSGSHILYGRVAVHVCSFTRHSTLSAVCSFTRHSTLPAVCSFTRHSTLPAVRSFTRHSTLPAVCSFTRHSTLPAVCSFTRHSTLPAVCSFTRHSVLPAVCSFTRHSTLPAVCSFTRHSTLPAVSHCFVICRALRSSFSTASVLSHCLSSPCISVPTRSPSFPCQVRLHLAEAGPMQPTRARRAPAAGGCWREGHEAWC